MTASRDPVFCARGVGFRLCQEHPELVAAKASEGVSLADIRRNQRRHMLKRLITHRVPIFIIHFLQIIQINEDQTGRDIVALD